MCRDVPRQSCRQNVETVPGGRQCATEDFEVCEPVTKEVCNDVVSSSTSEVCESVPRTKNVCEFRVKERSNNVQEQVCNVVTETVCQTKANNVCKNVVEKVPTQKTNTVCSDIPKQVCVDEKVPFTTQSQEQVCSISYETKCN